MDKALIEQGATLILQGLGVDTSDHNFATTPQRVAKVFEEVFRPPKTGWPVFDERYTDIVIMQGHTFWTFCPHHMLPVKLEAAVAYIPNGKVIGASKLVRMIHECNRMPMTQEVLTEEILRSIEKLTGGTSLGAAVLLRGKHGCMEIRGVRTGASMVTYKFAGQLKEDLQLQNRFFDIVHHSR